MNNLLILLVLFLSSNLAISQVQVIEDNAIDENAVALKKRLLNDDAYKEYKCNDTLFILFKGSKKNEKRISIQNKKYNTKKFIDTTIIYNYILKDSSSFGFVHRKYFDFDRIESNTSSVVIKKNKNFLRKNNKRIMNGNFFRKYSHYETEYFLNIIREIISSKKIVFIIDKDEFADKKIILRQVIIDIGSNIAFFMDKI